MRIAKKRCYFCGRWYLPNPKTFGSQVACFREGCRRERKAKANRKWREGNRGYEKGMGVKRKGWRETHSGYWRAYRKAHPDYVARDNARRQRAHGEKRRAAKQDEIRLETLAKLRVLEGWTAETTPESAAKQDEIPPRNPCQDRVSQWMEGVMDYLFWKEGAAKQDEIAQEGLPMAR